MNIDQITLGNGTVGQKNGSPTYRILHNPTTTTRSEVSCCKKNNPPPSIRMADDIDKRSKCSNNLQNVYGEIQNVNTTGSDNVKDNKVNQDDALTLRNVSTIGGGGDTTTPSPGRS